MTIKDSVKLMELYATCPKCGCEAVGNGKGTLECDTSIGYFKRTCGCGWYVEVQEGTADAPPEVFQFDDSEPEAAPEPEEVLVPEPEPEPDPEPEPEPAPAPTHTHTGA